MFKRLLLCVDLYEDPTVACDLVIALSQTFEASVSLLHVRESTQLNWKKSKADRLLDRWTNQLHNAGLTIDKTVKDGIPSQLIVTEARKQNTDLIVTVDAGRRTLMSKLLGSTTSKLVIESSRPILVASPAGGPAKWPPQSLLFPIDFSEFCIAATATVCELAEAVDCSVTMIHIDDSEQLGEKASFRHHKNLVAACERMIRDLPQRERINHLIKQSMGNIGATISTEAHAHDMIVIAATGKSMLERWLDGSVSEQVLRTAPCPVLVV